MSFSPPGYCPECGEYVEEGRLSCDSCGSCPKTGWSDEVSYDGLDLPGAADDLPADGASSNRLWGSVVGIVLLALLVYVFVFR